MSIDLAAEEAEYERRAAIQERASNRVTYDLSFKRAETPRQFDSYELAGDQIDDAYAPPGKKSYGGWSCPHFSEIDGNEEAWLQEFFCVAVTEAVHEALEWFRIDGRLVMNPHGKNETAIILETAEFARQMYRKYGRSDLQDVQGTCGGVDLGA